MHSISQCKLFIYNKLLKLSIQALDFLQAFCWSYIPWLVCVCISKSCKTESAFSHISWIPFEPSLCILTVLILTNNSLHTAIAAHRNLFPCLLTGRFQLLTERHRSTLLVIAPAVGLPGRGGNEEMSSDARRSTTWKANISAWSLWYNFGASHGWNSSAGPY